MLRIRDVMKCLASVIRRVCMDQDSMPAFTLESLFSFDEKVYLNGKEHADN